MSVLSPPRHALVNDALALARQWCAGRSIDGAPALAHAVRVAMTLDRYVPWHPPELTAAVLLHDSPEFAPAEVDLDAILDERFGPETRRIVRAVENFHTALGSGTPDGTHGDDLAPLLAATADKIVAFGSLLDRAEASGDAAGFWQVREPFRVRLPYFRRFHELNAPHLPEAMAAELARLVDCAAQEIKAVGL